MAAAKLACGSCQEDTSSNGTAAANRWHFPNQDEQVNSDRCRSAVSHSQPLTVAKLHYPNLEIKVLFYLFIFQITADRLSPQCTIVLLMLRSCLKFHQFKCAMNPFCACPPTSLHHTHKHTPTTPPPRASLLPLSCKCIEFLMQITIKTRPAGRAQQRVQLQQEV